MSAGNPLDHIIYITVPEETAKTVGSFSIDASIPLPVELPPGKDAVDLTELSWEMIISGMLKVFAYQPEHPDVPYYRSFIHAVQPNLTAELTQAGIVKAEAKDFDLAEEIFKAIKTLSPEDEKTYLNLALVYEQQMQDAREKDAGRQEHFSRLAHEVYRELLETVSESADAHYYAGSFYLKIENFQKAKEHFELFLGLAPEDDRADEAKDIIERIAARDEDDQLFAAAFDLIQLGREQEALERIEQFLENNPEVWNAWFLKGWALRRLERFAEAEQALLTCSRLEENQTDVFNELAICQMELGKFLESRQSLKKALALEPENVKIISNFGVLAMKMQNQEEAAGFFRTALEIDPENPVAKQYLEHITSK